MKKIVKALRWMIATVVVISTIIGVNDGYAAEIPPLQSAWRYDANQCTNFANASTWAADCRILDGGTWVGSNTSSDPLRCENAAHPRPWPDEAMIEPLAAARSGGSASLQGWQQAGEFAHCTGVFDTATLIKTLGVESSNVSLIDIDDDLGAWGARRRRDVECPSGTWTLADRCLQHPAADPYRAFRMCPNNATNPVNVFTGAKINSDTDFSGTGPNPLRLERYYSSRMPWRHAPWEESGFGVYWRHNYTRSISHFKGDTFEAATVHLANGNRYYFRPEISGDDTFWRATEPDISALLTEITIDGVDYWHFLTEDGAQEYYDKTSGRLREIINRDGYKTTFSYDLYGHLARVDNGFGRSLEFQYGTDGEGAGLISSVALAVNGIVIPESVIRYAYENASLSGYQVMLDKVIYPDETPLDLTDNPVKDYLYNEPAHIYHDEEWIVDVEAGPSTRSGNYPNRLTGIVDENGNRFATYKYQRVNFSGGWRYLLPVWGGHGSPDDNGDYANEYKISRYHPSSNRGDSRSHVGYAVIKDALGSSREFHFKYYAGVLRPTQIVGGKCEMCGSDSQSTAYDVNGFVISQTDFAGNKSVYARNALGQERCRIEGISTIEPSKTAARRIVTEWDEKFRVKRETRIYQPTATADLSVCDPVDDGDWALRHKRVHHFETGSARLSEERLFSYDASGQLDEAPRVTRYAYYGADNEHGLANQLERIDGPREDVNDVLIFRYATTHSDGHNPGDLLEIENGLGHVRRFTKYDKFGRPTEIQDPNGAVTSLSYHPRGWLKSRTIDGHRTSYEYDGLGQMIKASMSDGGFIRYVYDHAHRLTEIHDNLGNSIHYSLDLMGNRLSEKVTDAAGSLRKHNELVINSLNQIEKQIAYVNVTDAQVTGFNYTAGGLVKNIIDARDPGMQIHSPLPSEPLVFAQNEYDAMQRQLSHTDANGGVTAYAYDVFDQLASVSEPDDGNPATPQGLSTHYTYNSFGDLKLVISPDTGSTTYEYDSAGNRVREQRSGTAADASVINYTYDALNRLTLVDYPGEALDILYEYDDTSEDRNGVGRLTKVSDASGETAYYYDARGNTIGVETTRRGIKKSTIYNYNNANLLTSLTLPSGLKTNYLYQVADDNSASNLLSQVEIVNGANTKVLANEIEYAPFGPLIKWRYGNNILADEKLDLAYKNISINHDGVLNRSYDYDAANNILQIGDPLGSKNYVYDNLNRLTGATDGLASYAFEYDALGNRRATTLNQQIRHYLYSSGIHHLVNISGNEEPDFVYDPRGNVIAYFDKQLVYGKDERLKTMVTHSGEKVEYKHNSFGQRTEKAGDHTTVYYYDLFGRLIEESDKYGTPHKNYIYLANKPLAMIETDINPFDDGDDDGMLNGFELHFGFDLANAADAEIDSDGDGFSNLTEHDADSDPTDMYDYPNTPMVKEVPLIGTVAGIITAVIVMAMVLPHVSSGAVVVAMVLLFSWLLSETVAANTVPEEFERLTVSRRVTGAG